MLRKKYRVGIRFIHKCRYIDAKNIFDFTKEASLETYVAKYLQRRLAKAHLTDLGFSNFYSDCFQWDHLSNFSTMKSLGSEHLRLTRIKKLKQRKENNLSTWL